MSASELSVEEMAARFRSRELSPVEVIAAASERIAIVQPRVNAFTTLCLEQAELEARHWEREIMAGRPVPPLAGIPFGVKDIFDTAGIRTTYGAAIYRDHVPERDAEVVALVRRAGGVMVGKTSTHELAWGITSENPHYGPVRNPWDLERISGGSSGGSGAAIATGCVPIAIGSDTGGSTRVPASFCGVTGLKPTWGRLSLEGAMPLAPSLDHAGAMGRSPRDATALFEAMGGRPADGLPGSAEGLVVGVSDDLHPTGLPPTRAAVVAGVAEALASIGARVVEVAVAGIERIFATFAAVQGAEALAGHRRAGRWPERAGEFGADVEALFRAAEARPPEAYLDAIREREVARSEVARVFGSVDLLLSAVSACPPPPIGVHEVDHLGVRRPLREVIMTTTVPQDLLGLPTCAFRGGFDGDGLPVGVQLTGPQWSDARVLGTAEAATSLMPEVQGRIPPAPPA
jgi:aspartyl-tRNA(Asn)/glutamyl-tRNA(Gln) amidotransferase subunit A